MHLSNLCILCSSDKNQIKTPQGLQLNTFDEDNNKNNMLSFNRSRSLISFPKCLLSSLCFGGFK